MGTQTFYAHVRDPMVPSLNASQDGSGTGSSSEAARLEALRRYDILGSGPEASLDRIVRLAASLFEVPIAIVNFIGEDRQWFTSTIGVEAGERSLEINFCSEAIRSSGAMVVEDATTDERFADNPLVHGEPGVEFYAGAPLETPDGYRIGTLCVLDTEGRSPPADPLARLEDLADMVIAELELRRESEDRRRAEQELRESNRRYEALVEHFPDGGVFLFNEDLECMLAGGGGLAEGGLSAEEITETALHERYPSEIADEHEARFRATLEGERQEYEQTYKDRHYRIRTVPIRNATGDVVHGMAVSEDITDRKEQEREMRRLKAFNETLVEQAPVGLVRLDENLRIVYENPRAESIFGLPDDEDESPAIGVDVREFPAVVQAGVAEKFDRLLEGEEISLDVRYRSIFDREAVIEGRGVPLYSNDEFDGAVLMIEDVSEQRAKEQTLRERGRQLRQIRENVTDIVWMSTPDKGEMEFISEAYETVWGRPTEELKEEPSSFIEAVHPDDRERVRTALERQQQDPNAYDETYRVIQPDGEVRWVQDRAAGVYDEDGQLERIVGIATDITERKQMEEELRRTKNFHQQVHEQVPIDLAVFSPDAEFEYLNPESVSDLELREWLLGHTNEDYCRKRGIDPEFGRRRDEAIRETARRKELIEFEETIQTDEGPRHYLRVHSPVTDLEGRVTHVAAFGLDITERKNHEQKLLEAKEEAERLNRMKAAFLANTSHEIRTPLTSIIGFAEAIADEVIEIQARFDEQELGPLGRFAVLIEKSGRRLLETLDAVLNLSKLEAGEMELSLGPVNLSEEAEEAAQLFEPQAEEANIALRVCTDGPVWARADEGGLHMALRNLISNAVKYTEAGGEVWVRARSGEEGPALEVEDTGIGMDPDTVPELFEAFRQESEGTGRTHEGSGLGLAVTKRAVNQMGGQIQVETEKGTGTCVTVQFPPSVEARGRRNDRGPSRAYSHTPS